MIEHDARVSADIENFERLIHERKRLLEELYKEQEAYLKELYKEQEASLTTFQETPNSR